MTCSKQVTRLTTSGALFRGALSVHFCGILRKIRLSCTS